jgi:pentatricopeptide repeat protein
MQDSTGDVDLETLCNLIRTLVDGRQFKEALQVLDFMDRYNLQPNANIYIFLLKACSNIKDLEFGKRVHTRIQRGGLELTLPLQNSLLNMYIRCKDKSGISTTLTGFYLVLQVFNTFRYPAEHSTSKPIELSNSLYSLCVFDFCLH